MTYKSGEVPKVGDAVMGELEGAPARAHVLGVRAGGKVLLQRRAPYEGSRAPLKHEHHEAASEDFMLVYRHCPEGPAKVESAEAAPKAAKGRGKK